MPSKYTPRLSMSHLPDDGPESNDPVVRMIDRKMGVRPAQRAALAARNARATSLPRRQAAAPVRPAEPPPGDASFDDFITRIEGDRRRAADVARANNTAALLTATGGRLS